ncbi:hypothetical protein Tco_0155943 [Tanacetum coccineum]
MMNQMVRKQLEVATMQVNVQFLQQLQPEWLRFMTIVKQTIDLDKESYHKLFNILKHYQTDFNEICAEKIAKNANPLALCKEIAKPITPPSASAFEEDRNQKGQKITRITRKKNVEESRISPIPSPTRSPRNLSTLVSLDTEKLQELTVTHSTPSSGSSVSKITKTNPILQERGRMQAHISSQIQNAIDNAIPSLVDASVRSYMSGHILHVHPAQVQSSSVPEQQHQLYLAMKADPLPSAIRPRDQDNPYNDAHPEGENSAKRQKTSEDQRKRSIQTLRSFKSSRHSRNWVMNKYDVFSIIYEPVHGIIYTNSKKEKRVMRPSKIHKFCDATLRRTLEGLKSYYNDVKYGYVQKELTNDELEFLKLFEEEIEVRLKYRDQMRRWEMYVNGRPLGPRRECPK